MAKTERIIASMKNVELINADDNKDLANSTPIRETLPTLKEGVYRLVKDEDDDKALILIWKNGKSRIPILVLKDEDDELHKLPVMSLFSQAWTSEGELARASDYVSKEADALSGMSKLDLINEVATHGKLKVKEYNTSLIRRGMYQREDKSWYLDFNKDKEKGKPSNLLVWEWAE